MSNMSLYHWVCALLVLALSWAFAGLAKGWVFNSIGRRSHFISWVLAIPFGVFGALLSFMVIFHGVRLARSIRVPPPANMHNGITGAEMDYLVKELSSRASDADVCVIDLRRHKLTTLRDITNASIAVKLATVALIYGQPTKMVAEDPHDAWLSVPFPGGKLMDPGFTAYHLGGHPIYDGNRLIGAVGMAGGDNERNDSLVEGAISSLFTSGKTKPKKPKEDSPSGGTMICAN